MLSRYPSVKEICEARFRALTFSILPTAFYMYKEVEWYADKNEYYLASVIYDRTDEDWCYVIMARDEDFLFKCIEHEGSYTDIETARKAMFVKLSELSANSKQIHPQGDALPKRKDIFQRRYPEGKLNKNFILLRDNEGYSPAKEIIREITYSFIDCDGKFFTDFQLSGFDARIWELYLYAYLYEEHFIINREHSSPDYLCSKGYDQICIEATTVNPPHTSNLDNEAHYKALFEIKSEYNAIKIGRALKNKLSKKYWEKSHVRGLPLIFAIQSFESLGDSTSIMRYLYGIDHEWIKDQQGKLIIIPKKIEKHVHEDHETRSGFFFFPGSENISAILFSNSGTISKFNRMGKIAGFGSERVEITRWGACLSNDPNAVLPNTFSFEVTMDNYSETWGEGLCIFHNPNAMHPVDPNLFFNASHYFYEEGQIKSYSRDSFTPLWSQTIHKLKE